MLPCSLQLTELSYGRKLLSHHRETIESSLNGFPVSVDANNGCCGVIDGNRPSLFLLFRLDQILHLLRVKLCELLLIEQELEQLLKSL